VCRKYEFTPAQLDEIARSSNEGAVAITALMERVNKSLEISMIEEVEDKVVLESRPSAQFCSLLCLTLANADCGAPTVVCLMH
jgi:hypothetical protein